MRAVVLAVVFASAAAHAQDLASGKDVFGPCAACHGANGEGGKGGEYPRLAGQPVSYLVDQLKAFQERRRINLPMFPYTEPRELSPADMKDVAAYLHGIELPTEAPQLPETASALERLEAAAKVLVVPKVAGDVEKGKATFHKKCAGCHGSSGQGKKDFPRLTGQWPSYLVRQSEKMRAGERLHEGDTPQSDVLHRVKPQELTDVLAWLTAIQAEQPAAEEAEAKPTPAP